MDAHAVCTLPPLLLSGGDTVTWGSIVLDNIVVGVSGANLWFDEALAAPIGMSLRAMAKAAVQGNAGRHPFLAPDRH